PSRAADAHRADAGARAAPHATDAGAHGGSPGAALMSAPHFSPKAVAFLKGLKRNNNRDWFNARKDQYEELLKKPMLEIIEQLAIDFRKILPELSATPKSLFRIYRDTRFSGDKSPY